MRATVYESNITAVNMLMRSISGNLPSSIMVWIVPVRKLERKHGMVESYGYGYAYS